MGILKSLKNVFKGEQGFIDVSFKEKTIQLSAKGKAINHAIDMIASSISKCEIQNYKFNNKLKNIEAIKDEIYYKLNLKPNDNESGTEFFYRLVYDLLFYEEILIVEIGHSLYISTNWQSNKTILHQKVYSHVEIVDEEDNTITLEKTFLSSEVIHLSIKNRKITNCLDSFFADFGDLLDVATSQFTNGNASKWRLMSPGQQVRYKDATTGKEVSYEEYISKLTSGLFGKEDKVILLAETVKLENLNSNHEVSSEKILKLIETAENEVAKSFNIPLDMFHGNKTDKSASSKDYFTFAVFPIMQIIEDALNRTLISKEDYLKGSCLVFNRFNMEYIDILDSASGIDKLFSDGFSHNEICGFLNVPRLNEPWADRHFITKNYDLAENVTKGGDEDGR